MVISSRNFIRAFGGSIGLAVASAIFANSLIKNIPSDTSAEMAQQMSDSIFHMPDISQLSQTQQLGVRDAYVTASRHVFYLWVGAISICLLLMVFIKDKGLNRDGVTEKTVQTSGATSELRADDPQSKETTR